MEMSKAWRAGLVCLHPTDTLPGLSFRPSSSLAWQRFLQMKRRPPEKSPIALIADWAMLERCWKPLPAGWGDCLRALWPASLSVVWDAQPSCPSHLLAADGTCSLRMPSWDADIAWMRDLLLELDEPFPSSSVNVSGQVAIVDWDAAKDFLDPYVQSGDAFIPDVAISSKSSLSSSLIKINADGSWNLLREGALTHETIAIEVKKHVRSL